MNGRRSRGSIMGGEFKVQQVKTGRWPKRAVLLAPHTNEHHTVLPFQKALAAELRERGVKVPTRSRKDMMEQAWKLREFVGKHTCGHESSVLNMVLCTQDICLRLEGLKDAFSRMPEDTVAMEIHAMTGDARDGTGFLPSDIQLFKRVSETGFILGQGTADSEEAVSALTSKKCFGVDLSAFIDTQRESVRQATHMFFSAVSGALGFDAIKAMRRVKELFRMLRPHQERIWTLEVPGYSASLPETHKMHPYYFEQGRIISSSVFEETYASQYIEPRGFTEKDVERVSNIFLIR